MPAQRAVGLIGLAQQNKKASIEKMTTPALLRHAISGRCTFTFPNVPGALAGVRFDRWQIDVRGRLLGSIEELLEEGATPAATGARSVAVAQL
jgi:hypothetical protein